MHRIKLISLMLVFAITIVVSSMAVSADNDITQAWPVEVKCIPDPVLPPENWTYSGTILMSGYAGIHGIRADWETPHVIAFFRKDANGDYPLYGGQLSPDGNWYAAPVGEEWTEVSFNTYFGVHGVRVYSMSSDSSEVTFYLSDYLDIYQYFPTAWTYLAVEWQNQTSFMMGGLLFQLSDHTVNAAPYDTNTGEDRYFSPDLTRFYGRTILDAFGEVTTYQSLKTSDYSSATGLAKLDDPKAGVIDLGEINGVSWRRDSSSFIAEVEADNQLVLYDRDGKRLESVFNLGGEGVNFHRADSGRNDLHWSPDNQHYAFSYSPQYPQPTHLYVVNLEGENVTDTCLKPITQPVWSPDGKMLAYLALARENLNIVVVDVETWKANDIGRMSGRYTLSGSPEMVGWRA